MEISRITAPPGNPVINKDKESKPVKKNMEQITTPGDRVEVDITRGTLEKTQTKKSDLKGISLESVDTPLEVVCTPMGDPGLLNVVTKALSAKKNVAAKGTVTQGGTRYDVDFTLKENKKAVPEIPSQGIIAGDVDQDRGYDYQLTGNMGGMKMNLHCYQSGLSLMIEGSMGGNKVSLKNSYSILSGKIKTSGTLGKVKLDFWSKGKDGNSHSEGKIGGESFVEDITATSGGSTATGRLGSSKLSGTCKDLGGGRFETDNNQGGVAVKYQIKLVD